MYVVREGESYEEAAGVPQCFKRLVRVKFHDMNEQVYSAANKHVIR